MLGHKYIALGHCFMSGRSYMSQGLGAGLGPLRAHGSARYGLRLLEVVDKLPQLLWASGVRLSR